MLALLASKTDRGTCPEAATASSRLRVPTTFVLYIASTSACATKAMAARWDHVVGLHLRQDGVEPVSIQQIAAIYAFICRKARLASDAADLVTLTS